MIKWTEVPILLVMERIMFMKVMLPMKLTL